MAYLGFGVVTKSNGGLFTVLLYPAASRLFPGGREPSPMDGAEIYTRARGNLRKKGALLVGDRVRVSYTDAAFRILPDGTRCPEEDGGGATVEAHPSPDGKSGGAVRHGCGGGPCARSFHAGQADCDCGAQRH